MRLTLVAREILLYANHPSMLEQLLIRKPKAENLRSYICMEWVIIIYIFLWAQMTSEIKNDLR